MSNDLHFVIISTRYEQIGSTRMPFDRAFSRVNILSSFQHVGLAANPTLQKVARDDLLARSKRLLQGTDHELTKEEEALIAQRKAEVLESRSHNVLIETPGILTLDQCRKFAKRKFEGEKTVSEGVHKIRRISIGPKVEGEKENAPEATTVAGK